MLARNWTTLGKDGLRVFYDDAQASARLFVRSAGVCPPRYRLSVLLNEADPVLYSPKQPHSYALRIGLGQPQITAQHSGGA